MKGQTLFVVFLLLSQTIYAQEWVAPEGKVINDRTLVWRDFHGKPSREGQEKEFGALTHGALYFTASEGTLGEDGKMHFEFKVKCAFQSASWVRKEVVREKKFSDLILNHEQGHYDISLAFAQKLQKALSSRGYSKENYKAEIDSTYLPVKATMEAVQEQYDAITNHGLLRDSQLLWDYRIRRCLENNTDEYFSSPKKDVEMAAWPGQWVKKLSNEPFRQFVVRCRPLHSMYTDSLSKKMVKFTNWSAGQTAAIAFFEHNIAVPDSAKKLKNGKEILGYAYLPLNQESYRRVLLDTFSFFGVAPDIEAVFFANADADAAKELVVLCSVPVKNKSMEGRLFITTIFDDEKPGVPPVRLKRMSEISMRMTGGVEGTIDGKPSKARFKTESELREGLRNAGFKD